MEVTKQDIQAIDLAIQAVRKGHFHNIEGEEMLSLAASLQRLAQLKVKLQKQIDYDLANPEAIKGHQQMSEQSMGTISPPRPLDPKKKNLKGE